jgi:hypothetical protein
MSQLKKPLGSIFQHLTYDNYYLKMQNNDLNRTIRTLQANVFELNRFIIKQYDLSFNILENIRIVTFDGSGSVLSCIHSDESGNFVECSDISTGYLPCTLSPLIVEPMVSQKKISKTHMSDTSRNFLYDYPYYRYPFPRYPYGYRYPHYPYLIDDYYYLYREMDMSGVKLPSMQSPEYSHINQHEQLPIQSHINPSEYSPMHPSLIHGPNGTHIHIHNK